MVVETETVKIKEEVGRGTRGGPYVYVVEGNEFIHISEYAIRESPGKYKDEVIYEVPKNKLVGKTIYCFDFSRSGGGFLIKCKIDDFENGHLKKYEYLELLGERINEIRSLRFRIRDSTLAILLAQFKDVIIPIVNEIKEYQRKNNFEISFMGHLSRLENAFKDPEMYYFTFMSLPKDRSRINSLKVTRRWIYQMWLLKLACEALKISKFKSHEYEGKIYWWIEQGSELITTAGESPLGDLTFWLEFQPGKSAHMIGLFTKKRTPIRPDIVVVEGYFERTKEFIDSKKPIDLIIECKEDPFDKWKNEIDSQIIPYQETFKPKKFIIASLEKVPEKTKEYLEKHKITVVDCLKPKSENIEILSNIIWKVFK